MKNAIVLFLLITLFGMHNARASPQERSRIAVKGSELNSGVVILDIVKETKPYHLQCNQGALGCTTLKNGNYQMLELPENFGMYECKDVEVYPESAVIPSTGARDNSQKLDEYCLMEK